jgi:hypothetical protein
MGFVEHIKKSSTAVVLLSIIWGIGLSTLFSKDCSDGRCKAVVYHGPDIKETHSKHWTYGDRQCYKLEPYVVPCN